MILLKKKSLLIIIYILLISLLLKVTDTKGRRQKERHIQDFVKLVTFSINNMLSDSFKGK